MEGERERLEEYRKEVLAELERRLERVKLLDTKIAAVEFQLEATAGSRRAVVGDTGKLLSQAALREKIKRDRGRLQEDRAQAVDDVRSARERLQQVDAELSEAVTAGAENSDESSGDNE